MTDTPIIGGDVVEIGKQKTQEERAEACRQGIARVLADNSMDLHAMPYINDAGAIVCRFVYADKLDNGSTEPEKDPTPTP